MKDRSAVVKIIRCEIKMKLSKTDQDRFIKIVSEIAMKPEVMEMKKFIQHGDITTFDHCLHVAYRSFFLAKKLNLSVDEKSLVYGAMLHDFFLYDWHDKNYDRKRLHGFHHPKTALRNAEKLYLLSKIERDIIIKHMWPLTIKFPKYKESYVVTISDKICSLMEIYSRQNKSYFLVSTAGVSFID
jgi:uncharacterized protein